MLSNMNPMQMIQSFVNFKNNFNGNPEQELQKLLQSGAMSQKQLNQLQVMAKQFQQLLNSIK